MVHTAECRSWRADPTADLLITNLATISRLVDAVPEPACRRSVHGSNATLPVEADLGA
jgi:hypothetical protein